VAPEVLSRDLSVMLGLTLFLFLAGYGFCGPGKGRINRCEGGLMLAAYLGYTTYLVLGVLGGKA
jgi:cation:H+ antiporter